jgi:hypothetical protein
MGHNLPPAVQKKFKEVVSPATQIDWVLRYEDGTFARGRADCLGRELPKNGDGPKSPLSENGSLMPSAGTISI